MNSRPVRTVAFIGTHTPRQCGIATFTADLAEAVAAAGALTTVIAVNDKPGAYEYPDVVAAEINQHDRDDYVRAAEFLNGVSPDVVCVQHEYGIFGGEAGVYLLDLLRNLHSPIVTTLHTILEQPNDQQRAVLAELLQLSETVVVMTNRGRDIIERLYNVGPTKVVVVPHGIPVVDRGEVHEPFADLNLKGRRVILTFGLIAPDKGIENMIKALPGIAERNPDVTYLIAGATHPHIKAHSGESYREYLEELVRNLNVFDNVRFINRFLSLDHLTMLLQAAEIYVTPYLKKEQITSGTLAYAFGTGKAVVSTPYWHAEELLADGRGILVPFRDPAALTSEINGLLEDGQRLATIQANAYSAGLEIQWPAIGMRYIDVFEEAKAASIRILPSITSRTPSWESEVGNLPIFDPRHLIAMTDDTGMFQHATYSIPNRHEGYCTDDNARAARLTVALSKSHGFQFADDLQLVYVSFLDHSVDRETGRIRNFMGFDRTWLEKVGSDDSHGRALWALGTLASGSRMEGVRRLSTELFDIALPAARSFTSLRSWCFTLLGLEEMLRSSYCTLYQLDTLKELASKVHDCYLANSDPSWEWYEQCLSYDNARIPQALLVAAQLIGNEKMAEDALRSLDWLVHVQTGANGQFQPIGSDSAYFKGGERPVFDQQPLEATATMDACMDAYKAFGHRRYAHETWRAFAWFLGTNIAGVPVYDAETGGCHDGVTRAGVNRNQGAESTLAFLSALYTAERIRDDLTLPADKAYLQ